MKRILMLLMAVVLVLSVAVALVACDNTVEPGEEETTTSEQEITTKEEVTTPEEEITTEQDTGSDEPSDLENAAEYVRQLYKDTTVTAADYALVSSVKVGSTTYAVTWTVNTDKITVTVGEDGTVSVRNRDTAETEVMSLDAFIERTLADIKERKS